jgi:5-hydroxyisourate hydrolase
MPGISIHVVDVATGKVAKGMRVAIYRGLDNPGGALSGLAAEQLIVGGQISEKGLLEASGLETRFEAGPYEAVFDVGGFYGQQAVATQKLDSVTESEPGPFLDEVRYRFRIADPEQHYHLPFKMTAWGYSCFRGGA